MGKCKTKKTSRKPKKTREKKTHFPEVLGRRGVSQESQNIGFIVFFVFFRSFLHFSMGPSPRSLRILIFLQYVYLTLLSSIHLHTCFKHLYVQFALFVYNV